MKVLFFLIACLAINFLAANSDSLNTHMNNSEKSATGVDKLTPAEKAALQQWINTHHSVKTPASSTPASSTQYGTISNTPDPGSTSLSPNPPPITLSQNISGGRYIMLTDETIWEINPEDTPTSSAWITPVEMIISNNPDSNWPYILTNSATGSRVRAKQIDKLPQSINNGPSNQGSQVAPINDTRLGPP